jgi:hypothetical protein
MANEPQVRPARYLVRCGSGVTDSESQAWDGASVINLNLGRDRREVHLRLEHLSQAMCANAEPVATDLVELAAYVYAADQAANRGDVDELDYGSRWRRHFRFEVPVRRPDIWRRRKVSDALAKTLSFLSDDDYEFTFRQLKKPPALEGYLFGTRDVSGPRDIEEVILFSGGLDSLGGAVRETVLGQHRVALVSHRPARHVYARQQRLVEEISKFMSPRDRPLHVAVEVNKGKSLGKDFTQRSRSFLFTAVAAVVARLSNLSRVRFYENGVVSLNLPYSPQVLGGRATRTTHPRVLAGYSELLGQVFGTSFTVDNPYLWKTKASILRDIAAAKCGAMCAMTCSCARTIYQQADRPHCGRCSQCVDRRLSALAAGLGDREDPAGRYVTDVLLNPLGGNDALLAERYVGMLLEVARLTNAREFLVRFPEAARALRYTDGTPQEAAEAMFALYKEHAEGVITALSAAVARDASGLVRRAVPPDCLLSIAAPGGCQQRGTAPERPFSNGTSRSGLVLDDSLFEVRLGSASCILGHTLEYRLLKRLNQTPGRYIPVPPLGADVWGDAAVSRNAVQRVASALRRKLAKFAGLQIDGDEDGHYRLILPN